MLGITLIILGVVNTLALYILGKDPRYFMSVSPLTVANQVAALVGTTLLAVSFLMTVRFKVLEKLFGGLDKVYRIHHITGAFAFMFLINHPLFLMLKTIPNAQVTLIYLIPSFDNLPYLFGIAAFWLFIILISLTLFVKLPYHIWKRTHEYVGIVVLLGLLHVFTIESDVSDFLPLRIWMLALLFFALSAYAYIRFLYRFIGPHVNGEIEAVERSGDVINISIRLSHSSFQFVPGQFVFLAVKNPAIGREPHPFSISSGIHDSCLRVSVKIDGDYTLRLRNIKKGEQVTVYGPHGQFGERFGTTETSILVGGGIGIAPLVSMVRSLTTPDGVKKTYCYYSVSSKNEAVFDQELSLAHLAGQPVNYILNNTKENGRLTAQKIQKETGFNIKDVMVFLCGPQTMMQSLAEQFIQLGVRKSKISYEDFALR
ncbi:MAG: ferric reductase-like transmembrane domain-containing protein [Patescibacteria group bacterium]|jgi:predicted ferric reductase